MTKPLDVSGKKYGEWEVLYKSRIDEKGQTFYFCRCSCGNEKEVKYGNLSSGTSTNCGHISKKYKDICENDVFGSWTVIKKDESSKINGAYWLCRCSCGKERFVYGQSLLKGVSTNCGHKHNDGINVGDVFGRLTVIEFLGTQGGRSSIWKCCCSCGNIVDIKSSDLKCRGTISCGCYRSELSSKRATEMAIKNNQHFIKNHDWYFKTKRKTIKCKSSYEVFLWNYFYWVLGEKIEYEKKTFNISPKSRYTPDFYVEKYDIWIETKGSFSFSEKQKEKIKIVSKKINLKVLFWDDIRKLCELKYKTLKSYFDNSKRLNISIEEYLGERIYLKE